MAQKMDQKVAQNVAQNVAQKLLRTRVSTRSSGRRRHCVRRRSSPRERWGGRGGQAVALSGAARRFSSVMRGAPSAPHRWTCYQRPADHKATPPRACASSHRSTRDRIQHHTTELKRYAVILVPPRGTRPMPSPPPGSRAPTAWARARGPPRRARLRTRRRRRTARRAR